MKKLLLIILMSVVLNGLNSQTYRQYVQAADTSFYIYEDYHNAARFYSKALEFDKTDSLRLNYQLAESSRLTYCFHTAEKNYLKVLKLLDDVCKSDYKLVYRHLGEVYQQMGRYEEAIENFSLFEDLQTSLCGQVDPITAVQVKGGIEASEWAAGQLQDEEIEIRSLTSMNTQGHEIAPVILGDSIIFSAMRFSTVECKDNFSHQVADILLYDRKYAPEVYNKRLRQGKRDSSISYLAFNSDQTRIYYTVCYNVKASKLQCRIVFRDLNPDHTLGPENAVLGNFENDKATYTQPNIAFDEYLGKELIYFVSDKDGGMGGMDIWYSSLGKHGRTEGMAKNVQAINSDRDELSPYFHSLSNSLYFSTNNQAAGRSYGGFDVFRAALSHDSLMSFGDLEILPRPVNSNKHDIFYILSADESDFWLSSNRSDPYDREPENDACCFDIFEGTQPCDFHFLPIVMDLCSGMPVAPDSAILVDETANQLVLPDSDGQYRIIKDRSYVLTIAPPPGYHPESLKFAIDPHQACQSVIIDTIMLRPSTVSLNLSTWRSCIQGDDHPINGSSFRLTSLGSGSNFDSIKRAEDHLNSIHFSVMPKAKYKLQIGHPAYRDYTDTIEIKDYSVSQCDTDVAVQLTHWSLDQEEITLYFENDIPYPQPSRNNPSYNIEDSSFQQSIDTSWQTYSDTWLAAGAMINQDTTSRGFGTVARENGYKNKVDPKDQALISEFFSEARREKDKFDRLIQVIADKLEGGVNISLEMVGYASPLSDHMYNYHLSERRIDAIMKDILGNPKIAGYEKDRFTIEPPIAKGDVEGIAKGISDSRADEERSIYHPDAARERKITIRIVPERCNHK